MAEGGTPPGGTPTSAAAPSEGSVVAYGSAVAVTVVAITSQYFLPGLVPAVAPLYGSLAGGLAIVYGVPLAAFAAAVGRRPLERWAVQPGLALWEGLRWYALLSLLALFVVAFLAALYLRLDPAALRELSRPNPVLRAAASDPLFWIGFSFAIGAIEEVIFRGYLFGYWLARGTRHWGFHAVWTSALFAGVHLYYATTYGAAAPILFPALFLLGFAFAGAVRASGGNLWVVALLHGTHDSAAFLSLVSVPLSLLLAYGVIGIGAVIAVIGLARERPGTGIPPGSGLGLPWGPPADPMPDANPLPRPPLRETGPSPAGSNAPAPWAGMNPPDDELRRWLSHARTIAVVGLSDKPERDSNEVARYLKGQGYRIVPVNPMLPEVLGERSYPSLSAIPPETRIDLVDIFRRSDQVPPVVDEALRRGVGGIWMQLGVRDDGAAARARSAGVPVVQDLCVMVQHRRLKIGPVPPTA